MSAIRRVTYVVLFGAVSAQAATQTILGRKLVIKAYGAPTTNYVRLLSKEVASSETVVGNPVAGGGTLRITMEPAPFLAAWEETFDLPAAGWTAAGTSGFRFSNKVVGGPVKKLLVKKTTSGVFVVKAVVKGSDGPVGTSPPESERDIGVFVELGGGDAYCSGFGSATGGMLELDFRYYKVTNPTSEWCPVPPATAARCCDTGPTCYGSPSIDESTCTLELLGTLGPPGSDCDGATGDCVTPPGAGGPCCQLDYDVCVAGPSVDAPTCATVDGTYQASAICDGSGACLAP